MIRVHGNRGWTNAGRLFSFPDRRIIRLSRLSRLLLPNQRKNLQSETEWYLLRPTIQQPSLTGPPVTQFFINPQTVEFFFFIIIESNIISILKLSDNRFCVINIVISKYTLNSCCWNDWLFNSSGKKTSCQLLGYWKKIHGGARYAIKQSSDTFQASCGTDSLSPSSRSFPRSGGSIPWLEKLLPIGKF